MKMNEIKVNGLLSRDDVKYNQKWAYHLAVPRMSGTVDTLLVLSEEENLPEGPVQVKGHMHAEYIHGLGVPITIIPDTVRKDENNGLSEASLSGSVRKLPSYRKTKSGMPVLSVMLDTEEGPMPVLLWNHNAEKAKDLQPGDMIQVSGRLQSRNYPDRKKNWHTTYEVSSRKYKKF